MKMSIGVNANSFITYLVIFLILTVGISRGKPRCQEGQITYNFHSPCTAIMTTECRKFCIADYVSKGGACKEIPNQGGMIYGCACHGCK
ncbi:hypothetical protein AALP_AA4G038200 [Arabis alpina]|uniref:Knottin scorpion toxin-like domain-containing protein n=1 Tax=Arabis alpina TaxID=50452 RepID=A0A087H0Z9_ARAAL|nr:hypothetical protein AALP_AA4G038200 [Arabis alpina]